MIVDINKIIRNIKLSELLDNELPQLETEILNIEEKYFKNIEKLNSGGNTYFLKGEMPYLKVDKSGHVFINKLIWIDLKNAGIYPYSANKLFEKYLLPKLKIKTDKLIWTMCQESIKK